IETAGPWTAIARKAASTRRARCPSRPSAGAGARPGGSRLARAGGGMVPVTDGNVPPVQEPIMPAPRGVLPFLLLALVAPAAAAPVASVFGGRIACAEQSGVQFCQGDAAHRVESFDGVPLDVNVTLPPADQDGPFPLILDLHGWGGSKSGNPQTDF